MFIFPPFPSDLMTAYPVTPKMNRATFNELEAIDHQLNLMHQRGF